MNELAAFAAGHYRDFHGLSACDIATADAELGPPLEDDLHGGMFGGEPAQFRRYPAGPAAPMGVTVWVLGDAVIGLEIHEPELRPDAVSGLGPPEGVLSSELGTTWSQEIWGGRGIVLHRRAERIRVIFGLAPFEPDEWEIGRLAVVAGRTIRR